MSPATEEESVETASTHAEPGTEQHDEPNETTSLLKSNGHPRTAADKNVHYHNIDGTRFRFLFGSIIFGTTIAFFDSTLMASSHPVITSYFHTSNSASWLSTVFFLTSTVFLPLNGRISDTIGRRPVFLFAIFMFFISTAWCAAAQSIGSFIAARAACGLGAGGVISMAAILTSDVVKIEYRGIYQSYFNMAYGLGNGMGAAFGGLLCDSLGWRAAFSVQLPFIFVYGLLAFFSTPDNLGPNLAKTQGKTLREAFGSFDVVGALLLTVTITCLILGINLGGNVFTWTHPVVLTSLALFAVAAVLLVPVERRAEWPILPLPLLSTIPNANLMWSNFLGAIITNTVLFNVPLFLQAVRQTSATTSGLYLISPLVGVSITSVFAGFFITWTRRLKPLMVVGTISMLLGAVAVTCLSPTLPVGAMLMLIPGASIGQGFFFPATMITVLAINRQDEQAVVTTTLGLLRNLGAILGVALSSWVFQNALIIYLGKSVTGSPEVKRRIILQVRESIKAIATLDPKHKAEVIHAYDQALHLTFASVIIVAVVVISLILPIRLPRLQRQSDMDAAESITTIADGDDYGVYGSDDTSEHGSERPDELHRIATASTSLDYGQSDLQRRPSFETYL